MLIADDNPDLRRYLTSAAGAAVRRRGRQRRRRRRSASSRDRPPDLLISDVMMPGLDGYRGAQGPARLARDPGPAGHPAVRSRRRGGRHRGTGGRCRRLPAQAVLGPRAAGARARPPRPLDSAPRGRRRAARRAAALEQTVQQMPAGVMLAEAPSRRIVIANRQAAEILGHGTVPHEVADYDGYELYTLAARASQARRGPAGARDAHRRDRRGPGHALHPGDGRTIVVRISAAPVRDEQGEVVGGVLVFQDVSERVRTERLLAAQRDVLALIANGVSLAAGAGVDRATAWRPCPSPAKSAIMLLAPTGTISCTAPPRACRRPTARPPRDWRSGPTRPGRRRSPVRP